MDFSFSDEQLLLEATTKRFLSNEYGFERRSKILRSQERWSRDVWERLAELGLLGLNIPEEDGGTVDPVAAMLVSQALGAGLLLEPYHSSALVATHAIVRLGSAVQRARWLPDLASGRQVAVLAHDEPRAVFDPSRLSTRAARVPQGWALSGRKAAIYHAPIADLFLVSARLDGGETGLFALPASLAGIERRDFRTVDGQCAADLCFADVVVSSDACLRIDADRDLLEVIDYGAALLCAEALGCLGRVLEATIEYSRSRTQFGAPIGSFQALRHRMADMLIQVEQARSMTYLATSRALDADARSRRTAVSGAKAFIGRAARHVGQEAVQLHGGMGMTDELDVSHHFKRLLAFELRFGTTEEHLELYRRATLPVGSLRRESRKSRP
jgi:alkylation response protein AidB-like acyl-CoA dehydrogenase